MDGAATRWYIQAVNISPVRRGRDCSERLWGSLPHFAWIIGWSGMVRIILITQEVRECSLFALHLAFIRRSLRAPQKASLSFGNGGLDRCCARNDPDQAVRVRPLTPPHSPSRIPP